MSHFPELVSEFENFKNVNNITFNYSEAKKWGWRIGTEAKDDLIKHIDESWPDAEQELKDNFRKMFRVNGDLLGVQILGFIPGSKLYLLQTTEKVQTSSCNITQFWEGKIYTPNQLKCPITKSNFYWPITIKMGSMILKDSAKEYFDVNEDAETGIISYNDILYKDTDVYVNGKVNYKNGQITLTRYSKKNDEIYTELINNQGSSSNSSDEESNKPIYTKDSDKVNMTFTTYEGPVKKIFEFDIG